MLSFLDPLILLTCGYRYNQENHLWYMILMVHSTAYFVYDSIVEYLAGSDDFLTNLHHVCVIGMSFWHLISRTSGFEYLGKWLHVTEFNLVLHLIAESSNPFLIIRTLLKLKGQKDSQLYKWNEIAFAVIFVICRLFLTPLALIYIYEADRVIYGTKFGVAFVLYVQLFWVYRVLNLGAGALKDAFPESKAV